MLIDMAKFVVKWLNAFPVKEGIKHISPRTLVTGQSVDFNIHCKLQFGAYFQTHEDNTIVNIMEPRTLGAIALGPDNSIQTGYYCLNLTTGRRIHRRKWTALPMPNIIIQRIEALETANGKSNLLIFEDSRGNPIGEDEDPVSDDYGTTVSTGVDDDTSVQQTDVLNLIPRNELAPLVPLEEMTIMRLYRSNLYIIL